MADVFETTDYRWFVDETLRVSGRKRSHLAQAFGRSPAWLTMVLKGARALDPELVEPLCGFLGLNSDEASYFAALVDLHNPSARARRSAWATVLATQAHRRASVGLSDDVYRVFSHWYYEAIAELAVCEGFRPDPRWLAATLVPAITEAEASEALTTLLRLGYLVPDRDGKLVSPAKQGAWCPSDLPEGLPSDATVQGRRGHYELALRAMHEHKFNERHNSVTTMALSEAHYQRVIARIHELEREIVMLAMQCPEKGNRVYQFGLQVFPVTDYTDSTALPGADPDHST